jgi:hypothetical protein
MKRVGITELELLGINHDRDWFLVTATSHVNRNEIGIYFEWIDWIEDNTQQRWHNYGRSIWFESEQDALLFTMKWL